MDIVDESGWVKLYCGCQSKMFQDKSIDTSAIDENGNIQAGELRLSDDCLVNHTPETLNAEINDCLAETLATMMNDGVPNKGYAVDDDGDCPICWNSTRGDGVPTMFENKESIEESTVCKVCSMAESRVLALSTNWKSNQRDGRLLEEMMNRWPLWRAGVLEARNMLVVRT